MWIFETVCFVHIFLLGMLMDFWNCALHTHAVSRHANGFWNVVLRTHDLARYARGFLKLCASWTLLTRYACGFSTLCAPCIINFAHSVGMWISESACFVHMFSLGMHVDF